jgi:dTDP-4-amino-4,6-dideoxygalactose transaminase
VQSIAPPLPFALPDIGPEEIDRVVRCLESGWLTTGAEAKTFEREFSAIMGGAECVAVNSATAAFALLFNALKIGPGDEVLSSCWTFSSPAMEIWKTGAAPVLVDVDPGSLNMDVGALEARITPRSKGIVVTHFAGLPADMPGILAIARRHGLWVVEDAAHALPAYCGEKLIGTLDTLATVFSFYATKTITTGEGGMLVTKDAPIAASARMARWNGVDSDAFERYGRSGATWQYEVVVTGFKANMTDIAAAIGIAQLAKLFAFAEKRALLARAYVEGLQGLDLDLPILATPRSRSAVHLFVVRPNRVSRDALIDHLKARGIGTSVHFKPLHLHRFWRDKLGLDEAALPVASREFGRVVSLPLFTKMATRDVARVVDAIREIL